MGHKYVGHNSTEAAQRNATQRNATHRFPQALIECIAVYKWMLQSEHHAYIGSTCMALYSYDLYSVHRQHLYGPIQL